MTISACVLHCANCKALAKNSILNARPLDALNRSLLLISNTKYNLGLSMSITLLKIRSERVFHARTSLRPQAQPAPSAPNGAGSQDRRSKIDYSSYFSVFMPRPLHHQGCITTGVAGVGSGWYPWAVSCSHVCALANERRAQRMCACVLPSSSLRWAVSCVWFFCVRASTCTHSIDRPPTWSPSPLPCCDDAPTVLDARPRPPGGAPIPD